MNYKFTCSKCRESVKVIDAPSSLLYSLGLGSAVSLNVPLGLITLGTAVVFGTVRSVTKAVGLHKVECPKCGHKNTLV